MAIFASTTTSGYSDPMKALSIKALEQRQKDMQAQMAAQQPDAAMMATIPGGIGHVLGAVGDSMKEMRTASTLEANKAELAKAMTGYDPEKGLTPEQRAVMSRIAPELMEKYDQQGHDLRYQGRAQTHEGGMQTQRLTSEELRAREQNQTTLKNTELANTGRENTAAGDRASREKITDKEQGGLNQRQDAEFGFKRSESGLTRAHETSRDTARFGHEAAMERIKGAIAEASQQREFAFKNGQTDKVAGYDRQLAELNAELKGRESAKERDNQNAMLDKKIAADENQIRLRGELTAAEGDRARAAAKGLAKEQQEAEERIVRIRGDLELGRDQIKHGFNKELQAQAEAATSADVKLKADSAAAIAKAENEAKAAALKSDPKRAEAVEASEISYRAGLDHIQNMEEAAKILERPGGIYTGAAQTVAPIMGGAPILDNFVDKEMAQATARYNSLLGADAVKDMSQTLNGPTTNFEMQKFERMKNDPNISDAARAEQLRKVVRAAHIDLEAKRKKAQAIGGDTARVDKGMADGGSPAAPAAAGGGKPAAATAAPAGDDLSRAQNAINNGADYDAVANLLKQKGGDPALLKRKAP